MEEDRRGEKRKKVGECFRECGRWVMACLSAE